MSALATGWADPQRLADWLGHGVDAALILRIASSPRLASRCVRLVEERLGPVHGPADRHEVLSLDGLCLIGLAHQAGAIWHGRMIVRMIDGATVRRLLCVIGPGLRSFAMSHAGLVPASVQPVAVETLPEAIARDGLACLVAWCDTQPAPLGQRLTLRLVTFAAPGDVHRAAGPAIIDALLQREAGQA